MTSTPGEIVWLTDDALQPLPHARSLGAGGLLGQLLQARSATERQRLVRAALAAIGFDWLAYGKVRMQGGVPVPTSFFATYAEPHWTAQYFQNRLFELDFRHAEAPPSGLPRAWSVDELASRSCEHEPQQRQFAQALRGSALNSGVFMNLASPGGRHERTVVSLSSSACQRAWIAHSVLGQSVMLALAVHEFLSLHVHGSGDADPLGQVSPVQCDILRGLALGESDREISQRLQLSAHTVDYHLRCLRRRFSARNRAQLVCAAMEAAASAP